MKVTVEKSEKKMPKYFKDLTVGQVFSGASGNKYIVVIGLDSTPKALALDTMKLWAFMPGADVYDVITPTELVVKG